MPGASKKQNPNKTLASSLKKLEEIVEWFNSQQEVDVEKGLEKVKQGVELIKFCKTRLSEVKNEFEEIKKQMEEQEQDLLKMDEYLE